MRATATAASRAVRRAASFVPSSVRNGVTIISTTVVAMKA